MPPRGSGAHQSLADEHRVGALVDEPGHVVGAANAGLRDADDPVRDRLTHPREGREICRQRAQVAVVDADARRSRGHGDPRLVGIVDLDDRLRFAAHDTRETEIERVSVEQRDDQQHPVGTGHASFRDLHRVDGEVLAQQGDVELPRGSAARSSSDPPKSGPSVSTEIAAAPHAAYSVRG